MSPSKPATRLLLVDDDERLRTRLLRAFLERGIDARDAPGPRAALEIASEFAPDLAVIDLRMPGASGLDLLDELLAIRPGLRVVLLTGYGSISTAVAAVRGGAVDYLTKPADADQILAALGHAEVARPEVEQPGQPVPSLDRVEWEHIQRVLSDCGGNISEAARLLGVHRRTLQRKLATYPPRR